MQSADPQTPRRASYAGFEIIERELTTPARIDVNTNAHVDAGYGRFHFALAVCPALRWIRVRHFAGSTDLERLAARRTAERLRDTGYRPASHMWWTETVTGGKTGIAYKLHRSPALGIPVDELDALAAIMAREAQEEDDVRRLLSSVWEVRA